MPKVSIISVSLNNENGLHRTIQSVVEQTFPDLEFIVVDGGSVDNTLDLIRRNEKGITKWISGRDTGIFNAQNKGLEMATGEYCLFLNAGDTLNDLNVISDVFKSNPTGDIIYGHMIIDYPEGVKRTGRMPANLTFGHMMRDTLWHPVSFIRRDLFSRIGKYDESYRIASDYEFFIRAVLVNKVATRRIDRIVSRFSSDGTSSKPENREKLFEERTRIQLKYFNRDEVDEAMKISFVEKYWNRFKRKFSL